MATLSLRQAATEAGTSKSTILRAIQAGRLSASRLDGGGYAIDTAELFRVYPPRSADQIMTQSAVQCAPSENPSQVEVRLLRERLAELRERMVEMKAEHRQREDELRAEKLAWQTQAERLALAAPKAPEVIPMPGPGEKVSQGSVPTIAARPSLRERLRRLVG